jgi:VCBS repeat-containing protein
VPGGTINVDYTPVQFTQTGGTAPVTWSLTAGALPSGMTLSGTGLLAGTPTASGPFAFTMTATDVNTCTASVPLSLSILTGPNVAPSFTPGPNQTALEDAGPQSVAWATTISPGPAVESGQVVTFVVTNNTNPALFGTLPAISSTGTLTYTPAPNANGTATITVELRDNGGTASGGVDTSAPASFTITVTPVNDPPTADNDSYGVNEGATLTVAAPGVLDGETDPDGDTPITAVLVTGPTHHTGLFMLNADGSFTYTHDGSETTTDSFTYQASANGQLSNIATVTITITAVNDAPTAVNDVNTTTEDGSVPAAAPGVLVNDTDPEGGALTVGTVNGLAANVGIPIMLPRGSCSSALPCPSVVLHANGSYIYGPGFVFQSLGAGQTDSDTFTYTVQDSAAAQSNTATVTITITGINDAPVVTANPGLRFFIEDGPAVALAPAPGLTVTDVDNTTLASATVQITGNYQNGQDVLQFTTQAGITGVFNAGTGTLTLIGSSSLANYQIALQSITYSNTSQNPSTLVRTVQFQVNDGTVNSNVSTSTVKIAAVNDAPVVTAGTTIMFTEGNAATAIATTLTATDVDDTNLESATVTITNNYANGQDVLAFTNQLGITGTFVQATGVLTLTGTSSVANYQTALRSVTYFNGSNAPSPLARTVTWVVNDGDTNSAGATSTIMVIPVNTQVLRVKAVDAPEPSQTGA